MQNHEQSAPPGRDGPPKPARPSTNSDAHLLSNPLKRLSLHTAANTPLPQSPGVNSPRYPFVRRSSSVASLNRSSSPAPALARKSSASSLRGDMPGTPRAPVSRRSSFNPNMPSPVNGKSPLATQVEEKPPLRACDIAEDCFKKELALHEGMAGAANAGTIVIVHDQCYGHRYSRPKASKAQLSTIVERPERILAGVLGISAAYVRLGERHCEGSNPPAPNQAPPARIPFKIRKTARSVDLTSQAVTNVHGSKWMEELKSLCMDAGRKLASTGKELVRDPSTVPGQPKEQFHSGDLYLCPESLHALQGALGGVLDAVDAVFQGSGIGNATSRAFVCVRPPGHHCSADWPSGFCWLNNVHVGIEHAMLNYGLTHAAIIDFDLHHGDGSQAITWERNKKVQGMHKNTPNWKKTSIGYFSLHDINSFPCEDGDDAKVQAASLCIDNAHGQSIWNIHLEPWSTMDDFWRIYEEKYLILLDKVRQYLKHHTKRLRQSPNHPTPKAAIFISAGFDASQWETAGMQRHAVNVPTEFYARFTRDVVRLAEEAGTGVDGRIISVLEGGYSDRALASGILSHISGLCDGQVFSDARRSRGLAFDMQQRLNGLSMHDPDSPMPSTESELTPVTYDPLWWNETQLAELENLVNPPPVVIPKKVRAGPPAHFSSPTQSFTAKVVDPTKIHRTVSGKFQSASPSRAPTPPPPEVDWATASHALSKLLIPSDRQTHSYRAEELAEPKVKKEKPAPVLTSVHVDPSGRQLRGRRPVAAYAEPDSDDENASVRAESKANRRRTIADLPLAPAEPPAPARSASRRMSIASSIGSVSGERSASRASTVMPSRRSVTPAPGTNGVQVKKARGPTTATSRIPRNPPPVPRVPSNYTNGTASSKDKEKEKENDMDQLTAGMQRVTLKLAPKDEYEARQKQKEAEKKTKTATTRKTPAARTTKSAAKTTTTRKAPGRPPKSSKPPSPVEPEAPIPAPEPPKVEAAAMTPLEQPQPVPPEQTPSVIEQSGPAQPIQSIVSPLPADRRQSTDIVQPPTDLTDMKITPEQLPKSSFVTSVEPLPMTTSPPRPDTPPPPPPSKIPQFVNYSSQTFGTAPSQAAQAAAHFAFQDAQQLQWMPPNSDAGLSTTSTSESRPMSPSTKRQDLPVFTANGMIPFASNPAAATSASGTVSAEMRNGDSVKSEEKAKDIWDVPDTPAR
ncbi:Arginase/deacetylase [Trematosphaeria pertusa]|uniref:Arginase/deacetylase n=1 Tax=Trematosphaeria pertusa TaxID=390896 RepID=A0A6A6HYH9_9PLEO|nr:Arginase/deacetylase [Trematosphaeria pertusa]KAF2243076.1 Arginase/deacetylase [Trematosphaeria pertusa]